MASLRGIEVVHVPNSGAALSPGVPGTFRPGITPGSPSLSSFAGPLAGPLAEALGGVLGGLASGAVVEGLRNGGPREAQAVSGEGACVQHLHVSCGARCHSCDADYGYGDETECHCALDEGYLD